MRSLRRAAARFRDAVSIPVLAALLLIAAGAPLAADAGGERSRPNDSSDMGRSAQPRGGGGQGPSTSSPPPSSSGGSEPRVAVPRGSGGGSGGGGSDQSGTRQRPHNPGGGHGHHGGSWYGGYYPYYPYSYYPYFGPYWGWGWGSWWWWDSYYYGYGYGAGPYYRDPWRNRYNDRYGALGALDVDVSPGKTEVWVDGRYFGTADDFDGFPQYLWLDGGVYDVALFREGFKTIARQITIQPGQVMSMDDRMQPGESVRPEDLVTKTHERRDERLRYEQERRDEIARQQQDDELDDWRERARRRMEEYDRYEQEERSQEMPDDGTGRLRLDIEPADASVYLDGRFVGTGIDLQRSRNGIRLEPGEHRIAIVRPGHQAAEQAFVVAAGQEVELQFSLDSLD